MSFLEMLDVLNERADPATGEEPVAFDHDCREGICGMCGLVINGDAHGPQQAPPTCQLHMRHFNDGDDDRRRAVAGRAPSRWSRTWSSTARAFDRIIQAGGYITAPTGAAPEAARRCRCPRPNADARVGRRRLHRLRRLRGGLPERLGDAVHRRQGHPPRRCCRRASPSGRPRVVDMVDQHGRRGLRRLHQHRRVHGGLPQGDPARRDRRLNRDYLLAHQRRAAPTHRLTWPRPGVRHFTA